MQKIACIFSYKMSSWISCQKIVFNLHKAYQLNKDLELANFNLSSDQKESELLQTAQQVAEFQPDVIVFMDHKPHPITLLTTYLSLIGEKKPRFIFHIFGDFTLYYSYWEKLSKILQNAEVDFIVASDRQKHLIDKFLVPPMKCHVCPFPVDEKEFFFNPSLREAQRKEWGLKEEDIAFVFTGRLSRQKRIHTLIKGFAETLQKTKSTHAHLFLYGHFDHIGDQFLGVWETENEYFRKVNRLVKSLPPEIAQNIHFMGNVPNHELRSVYQGADMLTNLSVHNDEDYGMSVAEALASGLPAILTDWGGLASFEMPEIKEATQFIPVMIGLRSKKIHYITYLKLLEETILKGPSKRRKEISELALQKVGIKPSSQKIIKILKTKSVSFKEFSPFFDEVNRQVLFKATPYIDNYKQISKLYRDIYSSYVRHS